LSWWKMTLPNESKEHSHFHSSLKRKNTIFGDWPMH